MAKELVKVYETWTVAGCLRKIRAQAENNTVHSIYVVTKRGTYWTPFFKRLNYS